MKIFYYNFIILVLFHFFIILFIFNRRKFSPFNIKSINPIQKYPHYWIVCLYSINICYVIYKYICFVGLFKYLLECVQLQSCQSRLHRDATPNMRSQDALSILPFIYKAIQWVPIDLYSSIFISFHSFTCFWIS